MHGHVIIVGTLDDGELSFDGQPILTRFPSTFNLPNGLGRMAYSSQGSVVDPATHIWERRVVSVELMEGVQMDIFRWKNYLDFRLIMPAQPDQDGACGNFDGDPANDSNEAIFNRIGVGVEAGELLFNHRAPVDLTIVEEKLLGLCPGALYRRGEGKCQESYTNLGLTPTIAQLRSCILDICYGPNQHALRMAKNLGL